MGKKYSILSAAVCGLALNAYAASQDDMCAANEAKGIYEVECSNDYQADAVDVENKSGSGVLCLKEADDYINVT